VDEGDQLRAATWTNKKMPRVSGDQLKHATWTNKKLTGVYATWLIFAQAEEGGVLRNVKNERKSRLIL
jgi:hypothetical protein